MGYPLAHLSYHLAQSHLHLEMHVIGVGTRHLIYQQNLASGGIPGKSFQNAVQECLSYFAGALRSKVLDNLPRVDFEMWCILYNPADRAISRKLICRDKEIYRSGSEVLAWPRKCKFGIATSHFCFALWQRNTLGISAQPGFDHHHDYILTLS